MGRQVLTGGTICNDGQLSDRDLERGIVEVRAPAAAHRGKIPRLGGGSVGDHSGSVRLTDKGIEKFR